MTRHRLLFASLLLLPGCVADRDLGSAESSTCTGTTGNTTRESWGDTDPPSAGGTGSTSGDSATSGLSSTATDGPNFPGTSSSGGEYTTACVDLELGSATGESVASGTTAGRRNDYTTMSCGVMDGGGFVGPDRSDAEDFVIAWSFPATGSYIVRTVESGTSIDAILGVAPANCDADVINCDDECAGSGTALVISGNEGDAVHILVEGFSEPGQFELSITPGDDPMCGSGTTGGGSSTGS